MRNVSFELALCRYLVSKGCISFPSLEVVCNELTDAVGCFWLKPVVMVLFMLCCVSRVVYFITVLCSDVWNVVLCGNIVFSSVLANEEISEMGLYEVSRLLILFCLVYKVGYKVL